MADRPKQPPRPALTPAGGADETATRGELEAGLRFLHMATVQGRNKLDATIDNLAALIETLADSGAIEIAALAEHKKRLAARDRDPREVLPVIGTVADKYAVEAAVVPCDELVPICRAACCRMPVHLSTQDLDEGALRWDYGAPYRLRTRPADGYCVYNDDISCRCTVHDQRPGPCRIYDCRQDSRIWKDFASRTPSDAVARLAAALDDEG